MKRRDILIALMAVAILGGNFVAIKVGVEHMPPLLLTALRFLFAAVPAVFLVRPPRVPLRHVLAFGFAFGVLQFGLLFTAIHLGMSAGLSSVVIQMQVFFTIGLAYVCFREQPAPLQIAGGLLAGVGVVVIGAFTAGGVDLAPFLMVLGGAFAWGLANTIIKAAGRINPLALVAWGSLVAPLPLAALSLLIDGPAIILSSLSHLDWRIVVAVGFLAYPTTLLAFPLWNNLLARYPAATVTPFALLIPVVGIASTHLLLGETITATEIFGACIVLAGLALNIWSAAGQRKTKHVGD